MALVYSLRDKMLLFSNFSKDSFLYFMPRKLFLADSFQKRCLIANNRLKKPEKRYFGLKNLNFR